MTDQTNRSLPPFMFSHWAYLEPLRKHASFILVFVVAATLSALALTYVYSEKFETTVTLVFSPGEVTRLQYRGGESQAMGARMPNAEFKVIGKTVDDLSISEALLRDVVRQHDLDAPEERNYTGLPWYTAYYKMLKDYAKDYAGDAWNFLKYGRLPDEDPTASAVKELAKNIKITNQDSYVFLLKVRDKDARRVAAVADSVAQGLVREANESSKSAGRARTKDLEDLAQSKLQEIASYQDKINDYMRKNQIASPSSELEIGLQKLFDLQTEQLRLQSQIRGQEQKIDTIRNKLSANNAADGSPSRGQTRGASERLSSEDLRKLTSDKVAAEVEQDTLKAQEASLRRSINDLDRRLKQLPDMKLEIDQLKNDLDRVNREYGLISVALHELRLADSGGVSEWQIQHVASIPTSPVSPIKIYHTGLAAVLAVFVSIGLVYLLTYFNVRLFVPSLGIKGRRTAAGDGAPERQDAPSIQGNDLHQADIKRMPIRSQGGER